MQCVFEESHTVSLRGVLCSVSLGESYAMCRWGSLMQCVSEGVLCSVFEGESYAVCLLGSLMQCVVGGVL